MEPTQHRPNPRRLCVLCPDYGKKIFSPASTDCFARNSALRAALDPATDDLLFDIVINPCGVRAHRRPPAAHPLRAPTPSSLAAIGARLGGLRFDVTGCVTDEKCLKIEKMQQNQSCNFVTDEIGIFSALQTARE
jgi:hypothetical protein